MRAALKRPAVVIGIALAAVLVLGLVAILIGALSRPSSLGPSVLGPSALGPSVRGPSTVSGLVGGVRDGTFELLDGATSVRVRSGSIGDDLYRVRVPDGGGLSPRVDRNGGDVRLRLEPAGDGGSGEVEITLNDRVAWTLRMTGGARQLLIDMSGATTDEVRLAGGASLIEVALARPGKPVPLTMTGGADQFRVRVAAGTPVRVVAGSGAGRVTLGGETHQGVAGGQTFTAGGWRDGAPGVDVQAQAGAGAIEVTEG